VYLSPDLYSILLCPDWSEFRFLISFCVNSDQYTGISRKKPILVRHFIVLSTKKVFFQFSFNEPAATTKKENDETMTNNIFVMMQLRMRLIATLMMMMNYHQLMHPLMMKDWLKNVMIK
jgi:hypothetical protein